MPAGFSVIVVVLNTVEVDEDVCPFVVNIHGDGFGCKFILDFHVFGSFEFLKSAGAGHP